MSGAHYDEREQNGQPGVLGAPPKLEPFSREALQQKLNAAQVEAVLHPAGPLLVVAGAGSGKTRVITFRLARMVATGADPRRILAVTFTNKAAGELRERVDHLLWRGLGIGTRGLWVGTFHSIAARLLRQWGETVGLRKDFVIYDDDDQKRLLARVLTDLKVPERMFPVRQVLSAIDRAKNQGISAGAFNSEDYFDDVVGKAYRLYEERLAAANATDFGGLLMSALDVCAGGTPAAEEIAARFDHVLVDEFQDTNSVQYRLVRCLSRRTGSITVVGDEDQSIYRWRGADIRNILDFERDHPGACVVKLERNYRSTGHILRAANAIIEKNTERRPKRLFTEEGEGELITLFEGETERDEAEFVAQQHRGGPARDPGRRATSPCSTGPTPSRACWKTRCGRATSRTPWSGGTRFFDRAEIKDLICYLRAIANPDDGLALQRIINMPARGIGDSTVDRIGDIIHERKISAWQALEAGVDRRGDPVVGAAQEGGRLRRADEAAAREGAGLGPASLAEKVLEESGYRDALAAEATHGGRGADGEPARARGADARVREGGRGAVAGRLPRADRAGLGRRRLRSREGRGLADDGAHRQGARVPGGVPHRPRGADLPARAQRRRRLRRRGGAPALLRRGDPRAAAALPVARASPPAVGAGAARRPEPLPARSAARQRRRDRDGAAGRVRLREHATGAAPGAAAGAATEATRDPFASMPPAARRAPATRRPGNGARRQGRQPGELTVEYDGDAEPGGLQVGAKLRHASFGVGEVRAWQGAGAELKVTMRFPTVGVKTILARFLSPKP